MNSALNVEMVLENPASLQSSVLESPAAESPEATPSRLELFSYTFCCAVQGLIGLTYLALITLLPVAIQQGLLF